MRTGVQIPRSHIKPEHSSPSPHWGSRYRKEAPGSLLGTQSVSSASAKDVVSRNKADSDRKHPTSTSSPHHTHRVGGGTGMEMSRDVTLSSTALARCIPADRSDLSSTVEKGERSSLAELQSFRSPLSYRPPTTVCSADGFCGREGFTNPAPESSGTSPDSGVKANPTSQKRKGSPIRGNTYEL